MEKLLDNQVVSQIKEMFGQMKEPVQILFFASESCEYCADTRQLLEEVADIDERVHLSVHDLQQDASASAKFNVDKVPGIVVAARDGDQVTDFGIQYSGIPSGHEFGTLINDILLVSGRDSGLNAQTREYLQKLSQPLHMQVFVTPTCPYCPQAVLLSHRMAMENPAMIRAEGVEATEFSALADQFGVSGVPQTTINAGAGTVVGAVPERQLLAEVIRAMNVQVKNV